MIKQPMKISKLLIAAGSLCLATSAGCATPWGSSQSKLAQSAQWPSPQATAESREASLARTQHSQPQAYNQPHPSQPQNPVQQATYTNQVAAAGFGHGSGGLAPARTHHAGPVQHQNQCTAGCCGPRAPVYPCMPPLSNFGLDSQEFLCDGGDRMPKAAVRLDDKIIGVGLEDTVVKYETMRGTLHVEPSNRVCLYAPRFASVRRITGALTDELATGPIAYIGPDGPGNVLAPQPSSAVMNPVGPEHSNVAKGPDALRARDPGVPIDTVLAPIMTADVLAVLANLSVISDGILRDADKPWLAKGALAAVTWSLDQAPQVVVDNVQANVVAVNIAAQGITAYELPGGRLRVIKVADRNSANVGDIVTFVIRVDNTGEGKLSNVVLTDNLTTRLEFIPNSQTCTKGVEFDTEENEGGSLRLTWKFTDDFEVGEGAIVRFRCRVR